MKQSFKLGLLTLAAGVTLLAGIAPASADDHGWHNQGSKYNAHDNRGNGRNNNNYNDRYNNRYQGRPIVINRYPDRQRVIVINNRDRTVIRDYRWQPVRYYGSPRYLIGAPLPRNITYYPVPQDVIYQLQPVPYGYRYVRVDNDVLLLDAAANVIDAVSLLSQIH